jgi:LuxR family transcriptional regulator, maltose regulon positive regulatory protein
MLKSIHFLSGSNLFQEQTLVMETPLLATKLYIPPLAPSLVTRHRLLNTLSAGLRPDVRLTLVSASPGFGKTTLVLQWLQTVERPVAWLSLDGGDNDLVRFANYLAAALLKIGLEVSSPLQVYTGAPYALKPDVLLAGLLNEVSAAARPFVLVLDDYFNIETQSIHDAVAFLIEHQPPHMHLVITTRKDPPLPLSRLRARRQVNELRTADLRFTSEESAALLRSSPDLNLSEEDIAAIEQRTEGWVAALHLVALSLRGRSDPAAYIRSFSGEDRHLLDYLVEEVLHQQSPEVQAFMLQTSILEQLTTGLCDYLVTGKMTGESMEEDGSSAPPLSASLHHASDLLQHLERSNLFLIPQDSNRKWYRYHRLFGDFLRVLLKDQMPDIVPSLHRRAASWYEQNGWTSEAIRHALAGQDYDRAVRLIAANWSVFFARGEVATLADWTAALPSQVIQKDPELLIIQAWSHLIMLNMPLIEDSIARARILLKNVPPSDRQHLEGAIAALRAYLAFFSGDMSASIAQSNQALQQLSPHEDLLRGRILFILGSALLQDGQIPTRNRSSPSRPFRSTRKPATCSSQSGPFTTWPLN